MRARPHWGTERLPWAREAGAVFVKELRGEWRTRVAVSSVGLFAVGSLLLVNLALRVEPAPALSEPARASLAAALLWTLLFFTAATGLGRAYVLEEERGTALALRLWARATTVWAGKFAANAVLLGIVAAATTPALLSLLGATNTVNPVLLFCVLLLGVAGVAATFTFTSALVAQASAKGGLLAALAFPALVPLLLAGVQGTKIALGVTGVNGEFVHAPFALATGDLQLLFSYAVISITASLMLIDFVWND